MPLIKPPNDYGIPEPKFLEEPISSDKEWEENRRIQLYMDIKPWQCPECGTKMFGRVKACVYCKFRHNKHVPRPSDFKFEKRDV